MMVIAVGGSFILPLKAGPKRMNGEGMPEQTQSAGRMYRELADRLIADISSGVHCVGKRLPGERDLALQYGVSRGTVREAVIVLEMLGIVEVKVGSGAHILRADDGRDAPHPVLSAFEVAEALLLIEGEAAALAALQAEPSDLLEMGKLIQRLDRKGLRRKEAEILHRDFHLAIAKATRNHALQDMVERLWELRGNFHDVPRGPQRMQSAGPLIEECEAVLDALRAADPVAARSAMRAHLSAVLDGLVFRAEEAAVAEARRAAASRRARYAAT